MINRPSSVSGAQASAINSNSAVQQQVAAQAQAANPNQQLAVAQVVAQVPSPQRLQDMPLELLEAILASLSKADRLAINNFAATCTQLHAGTERMRGDLAAMDIADRIPPVFSPTVSVSMFRQVLAVVPQARDEHALAMLRTLIKRLPVFGIAGAQRDWAAIFHALLSAIPQARQGTALFLQRQFLLEDLAALVETQLEPDTRVQFYCALVEAGLEILPQEARSAKGECDARMFTLTGSMADARSVLDRDNTIMDAAKAIGSSLYAFPVHEGKAHLKLVLAALRSLPAAQVDQALTQICLALRHMPPALATQYAPDILDTARYEGSDQLPDSLVSPLLSFASSLPADVQLELFDQAWKRFGETTEPGQRKDWALACMTSLDNMGPQAATTCMPLAAAAMDQLLDAFAPEEKPQGLVRLVRLAKHVPPKAQLDYTQGILAKFGKVRADFAQQRIMPTALCACFTDMASSMPLVLAASVYTDCALSLAIDHLRWPHVTRDDMEKVCDHLVHGMAGSDQKERVRFFTELCDGWLGASQERPLATKVSFMVIQSSLLRAFELLSPANRTAWSQKYIVGASQKFFVANQLGVVLSLATAVRFSSDTEPALAESLWSWYETLAKTAAHRTPHARPLQVARLEMPGTLHMLPPGPQREKFLSLWNDLMSGPAVNLPNRPIVFAAIFISSTAFKTPGNMKMAADRLVKLLQSDEGAMHVGLLAVLEIQVRRLPAELSDQLVAGLVELRNKFAPKADGPKVEEVPAHAPGQ